MEFFRPGIYIDFMRLRAFNLTLSLVLFLVSVAFFVYPGPNWGIDFAGGTEIQLRFRGNVSAAELRSLLIRMGHSSPDVVKVEGVQSEYILRIREMSSLSKAQTKQIEQGVRKRLQGVRVEEMEFSPGGDKISFRLSGHTDPSNLENALRTTGAKVRLVSRFGKYEDHRYEAQLVGVADQVVRALADGLGARGPEAPRRIEWVGPKAGEQLRNAAIQSLLYAIAFIMVYVALRFDLRFAPGGVIAMVHDAVITTGVFILIGKEINLTLVAAILTIVGYSINDTIVVYDRVRENMARRKDMSLREIVNVSTSETLSRTIITGGTTLLSLGAFFVWGTQVIQDFALALIIGILVGTYSSIYVAAPITEWMDRTFFRRA